MKPVSHITGGLLGLLILAFHVFLTKGAGLTDPPLLLICVLAAFLLFSGRKAFASLLN